MNYGIQLHELSSSIAYLMIIIMMMMISRYRWKSLRLLDNYYFISPFFHHHFSTTWQSVFIVRRYKFISNWTEIRDSPLLNFFFSFINKIEVYTFNCSFFSPSHNGRIDREKEMKIEDEGGIDFIIYRYH